MMLISLLAASAFADVDAVDLKGHTVRLPVAGKVTCLLFVGTDCPIANRMAPELKRIVRDHRGVSFYFVYPVPKVTAAEAAKHQKSFGLNAPGIADSSFAVARFAKASVTPEAAVYTKEGGLAYRGRINDFFVEHNVSRAKVLKNDLRDALRAVLSSKPVETPFVSPIGCAIPFGASGLGS